MSSNYFEFDPQSRWSAPALERALTGHNAPAPASAVRDIAKGAYRDAASTGTPAMASASTLADQFVLFQLSDSKVIEPSLVEPSIEGSEEHPDMLVDLSVVAFNTPPGSVDASSRATVRLTLGKDPDSTDRYFDAAYWCIASGVQLYDDLKKKSAAPGDLKADYRKAFGNRPIEVPGSLGLLNFEVVRHKEDSWWRKLFRTSDNNAVRALVDTLGFPAISLQAISLVDQLFEKFERPEVLFKSRPLTLALSQFAKAEYAGSNATIKVGSLNKGFSVLLRGADQASFKGTEVSFYPSYGVIAPAAMDIHDLLAAPDKNPFNSISYTVLRVGMKPTKLDPKFNY